MFVEVVVFPPELAGAKVTMTLDVEPPILVLDRHDPESPGFMRTISTEEAKTKKTLPENLEAFLKALALNPDVEAALPLLELDSE